MKQGLLILCMIVICFSCSKKEDPYEREKKEMKVFYDNSKLLIPYKGVKIALRTDYEDKSSKSAQIGKTGLQTLSAISSFFMRDSMPQGIKGMQQVYTQVKGLYELKQQINAINEDELPTIYSRLSIVEKQMYGSSTLSKNIEKSVFGTYNNSTEHFLLGCLWFVLPSAPADMYVYEASQINENEISMPDQHLFASLLKALVCEQKEWHYTSEKSSTEYINYITDHKKEVLDATEYLSSLPGTSTDNRFYELRSVGYALRGLAKHNSDREKEANEDFDHFVDDFEKSGVQNKELCFLSSYLCIRNNKPDKAEMFLSKMEQLPTYNEHDKQTVVELRGFIKDKNGKKFNKYFDSFSLSRIAFMYFYEVSTSSDMAKQMNKNDQARKLMAIPSTVNNAINYSGKLLNTDSLIHNAGSLVKDFFK